MNAGTAVEHVTKARRKYKETGKRCEDCGYHLPVTTIHFWATNMEYTVCKECIKPYRRTINKPCSCEGN